MRQDEYLWSQNYHTLNWSVIKQLTFQKVKATKTVQLSFLLNIFSQNI